MNQAEEWAAEWNNTGFSTQADNSLICFSLFTIFTWIVATLKFKGITQYLKKKKTTKITRSLEDIIIIKYI